MASVLHYGNPNRRAQATQHAQATSRPAPPRRGEGNLMPTPCAQHCASHALACGTAACTRPESLTPNNILSKFICLKGHATKPTANINQVMSRACGHTPEHTPLRVQSSACPRKQPMAYKAHTPPCAAHPHAQSQDEHRTNATSKIQV